MKRKKMLKRFLSFILCFAMLLSAISGAVFADYYEVINDTLILTIYLFRSVITVQ